MNKLIALTLVSALAGLTLPACNLIGGCGGYAGGGDTVYERNTNDLLILCDNGGFVEKLDGAPEVDGFTAIDPANPDIVHATIDASTTVAFTLTEDPDGQTATAPELGTVAWTAIQLDTVALDHANTQCARLPSNTWWGTGPQE